MRKSGKPSTVYSDNPKMGKGYAEGGLVRVEGEVGQSKNRSGKVASKVTSGGGRVEADIPTKKGAITVGAQGGGAKYDVKFPGGNVSGSNYKLSGADLTYRTENNDVGIEWRDTERDVNSDEGRFEPTGKRIMFRLNKRF